MLLCTRRVDTYAEGDSDVEPNAQMLPVLADGLVGEVRSALERAMAVTYRLRAAIGTLGEGSQSSRVSGSLLAGPFHVADIIYALRAVELLHVNFL